LRNKKAPTAANQSGDDWLGNCQRVFKTSVNGQEVVAKSRLPLGCAIER
jgi:hypothetical protein